MLEFLENVRISRKALIILEKATISRKCQNYLKMLEFLENVRIAKNIRISRIATISRNFYNFSSVQLRAVCEKQQVWLKISENEI